MHRARAGHAASGKMMTTSKEPSHPPNASSTRTCRDADGRTYLLRHEEEGQHDHKAEMHRHTVRHAASGKDDDWHALPTTPPTTDKHTRTDTNVPSAP